MVAHGLAVCLVWFSAALLVWTPARGIVQDFLFQSPYYPVFHIRENDFPWAVLHIYLVLTPLFHYTWIRVAQPSRHAGSGYVLFVAFLIALGVLADGRNAFQVVWVTRVLYNAAVYGAPLLLLLAGWRLHQRVEVQR
jgi:phosphoglycerol transferase MdoB-like AlkP superfamily enzyme